MQITKAVRYDPGEETEALELAFKPIARIEDYPDLLDDLADHGVDDFYHAEHIARTFTPDSNGQTGMLSSEYLRKAHAVLMALKEALQRDLDAHQSPATIDVRLLALRRRQIDNIEPGKALLDTGISEVGYVPQQKPDA